MEACTNCSTTLADGDAFCGRCGTPVPLSAPAPAVASATPSGSQRPPYDRTVERLDPLATRYRRAAAGQAAAYTFGATIVAAIVFAIAGTGSGSRTVVGLAWIGAFVLYLVLRIPVALSEWKTLVEDRGAQAQDVFGHVAYALRRRRAPVDSLGIRRLSQPGHPRRDFLEARHGILTAYVTCFPYGTDLYAGWTLWWRISPLHYALMTAGRRWQKLTGRATELHLLHRYDVAKALREAIHAATCEAVDAANGLLPLHPLPGDVSVEVVEAGAQWSGTR